MKARNPDLELDLQDHTQARRRSNTSHFLPIKLVYHQIEVWIWVYLANENQKDLLEFIAELLQDGKGGNGQRNERLFHHNQLKTYKKFSKNSLVEQARLMVKLSQKLQETVK